ncbi:MAG: stage 0 sporulation protein J, partial [bacterium]
RPDDQKALGRAIQKEGLSVRATEVRARKMRSPKMVGQNRQQDVFIQSIAEEFTRNLGTKVVIRPRRKGGVVEIHYFSDGELEGLRVKIRG